MKQLSCENEYSKSPQFLSSEQKHPVNNATSCRAPVINTRYRGQALLISVLLMIFASVLAATFVTVVALNLSQTARSGSVASARTAALAGKTFVNEQLTNSELGELWRPSKAQTAPTVADPAYQFYYSDFERAQGWDQQGYVKFPDPRTTSSSGNNTSVYLVKVIRILDDMEPITSPMTEARASALGLSEDYIGQLRVEVIGRAGDSDLAYDRLVFYKPTSLNGNFTTPARYVSRWDFAKNKISDTAVNPLNTAYKPTKLIGQLLSIDSERNDSSLEDTSTPLQTAVGGIHIQGDAVFQGKSRYEVSSSKDIISVTGSIGVETTATPEIVDAVPPFVNAAPLTPVVIPPSSDTTTPRTGLLAQVRWGQTSSDPTSRQGSVRTITPARIDTPNSRWRQLSQYADIAGGSQYGWGGGGVYIDNESDVEAVRNNRPNTANDDVIPSYRRLTVVETQRLLQRKSFPVKKAGTFTITPGLGGTATYQYENGNTDLTPNGYTIPGYTTGDRSYNRLAFGRTGQDDYEYPLGNIGSLEQRAIRGWVSNREFIPRGALVELKGDTIVITRDDLSDGSFDRPDPAKTWKKIDGTPIPYAYRMELRGVNTLTPPAAPSVTRVVGAPDDSSGVYSQPASTFNGVIFAEGNVRVRGFVEARNITVVSMGNIYIEGGINKSGAGHVALLAKKNVVFNPTQIMTNVEGSQNRNVITSSGINYNSINNTAGSVSTVDLPANSTTSAPAATFLRIGDQVRFPTGNAQWHTITAIQPTTLTPGATTQITLDPPIAQDTSGPISNGSLARLERITGIATDIKALDYINRRDILARDFRLDGANAVGTYWMKMLHLGRSGNDNPISAPNSKIRAFNLGYRGAQGPVQVNIKQDTSGDGRISAIEQVMKLDDDTKSPYDLLNLTGSNGGDATETFRALTLLFHDDTVNDDGVRNNNDPLPFETDDNATWDIITNNTTGVSSINRAYYRMAARRLASLSTTATYSATDFTEDIDMSTSVGLLRGNNLTDIVPNLAPEANIGSAFDPRGLIGTYRNEEYLDTVETNFIRRGGLVWTGVELPVQPNAVIGNVYAFRRDQSDDAINLPGYQISTFRLDRANLAAQAADPITVTINATMYAQDGSWFVIPMPQENVSALTTDEEKRELLRPNYQIVVEGNIAENFMATTTATVGTTAINPATLQDDYLPSTGIDNTEVDPDNNRGGAQLQWINAASRPGNGTGTEWQTIAYKPSTYVQSVDPTNMLYLPITPDITLQR